MADNFNIYKFCDFCGGDGKQTHGVDGSSSGETEEVDCHTCNGEGKVLWGEMLEQEAE